MVETRLQALITDDRFVIRLLRFVFVGGTSGISFVLIVAVCVATGFLSEKMATVVAYLMFLPLNFMAHKHGVFRSVRPSTGEWIRYLGMHIITMLLCVAAMALVTDILGFSHWYGSLAAMIIAPLINLALMEFWVFGRHNLSGWLKTPPRCHARSCPGDLKCARRQSG